MWSSLFGRPKVDDAILQLSVDITQLPQQSSKNGSDDLYCIFLRCRENGLFANRESNVEAVSRLRCLVDIDRGSAIQVLANTVPPNNVLHAIERLIMEENVPEGEGNGGMFRFVTGCGRRTADRHYNTQRSVPHMHAYYLLLSPEMINQIHRREEISINESSKLFQAAEKQGIGKINIALMRQWKPIPRDTIQDIFNKGCGRTMDQAKHEYPARELREFGVDRRHAMTEIERSKGNFKNACRACAEIAETTKKHLEGPPIVPTRDNRGAPNVTKNTRIVALLGDGWMVSDFYLWLHVVKGMGKSQEWITSMSPEYLLKKYGREDKTVVLDVADTGAGDNPANFKPVQTKWASGLIHGDPFEARKVVLDDDLLPEVQNRVTVISNGQDIRDFFFARLKHTISDAEKCGDRVLLMIFSHGDYETQGGLCLGFNPSDPLSAAKLLKSSDVVPILSAHSSVATTMFMTSCFSGHWVETTEYRVAGLQPVVLAAAESDQESHGFVWTHSQRHAGGLFSAATITELLKEPCSLPEDASKDTSRNYQELVTALTAETHRLCLPANISEFMGSSPVFTDPHNQEKFWHRTGYSLHNYKANYSRLKTIPASDPHPKRTRKKFAEIVDGNDPDIVAWRERHPGILDEDFPEATASYGSTTRGLLSKASILYFFQLYQQSRPRGECMEDKFIYNNVTLFRAGRLSREEKVFLRRVLIARLQLNETTNQYARALGLYRLQGIEYWGLGDTSSQYDSDLFRQVCRIIFESRLFHVHIHREIPEGMETVLPHYRKPSMYLAASMLLAGYSKSDAEAAMHRLREMRKNGDLLDIAIVDYMGTARQTVAEASNFQDGDMTA
ncbi:hypothetical protein BDW59DRAFT_170368 [Aspergillus cavernicola]|uniref:Caspase domain-containing protein n=1 Tax=Aspergillus cavernicola TaxID=176166 RepID=A0ABR4IPK1_9EURO